MITDKILEQLQEANADEFRFRLKKVLTLNKSQMQRIIDFVNKGNYSQAMIAYQNFLRTTEEAAQNFIIGIAAAHTLSDKSKFGKTVK